MSEALTAEDRLLLHELPGVYGDAVDDRNWDELDRVFTSTAVFEVRGLVTMNGLDDIKHYMEEEGRHPLAHFMVNIHITEDERGVRLYSRAIAPIAREDTSGKGYPVLFGSYYDDVVKTDAGWRIQHRVFSSERINKRMAKVDRR
ncbi:MAG: nuclear transport factor 2 family protein [Pseudomonadales bacterium]